MTNAGLVRRSGGLASGDRLAQVLEEPFEPGHAFTQPADFGADPVRLSSEFVAKGFHLSADSTCGHGGTVTYTHVVAGLEAREYRRAGTVAHGSSR